MGPLAARNSRLAPPMQRASSNLSRPGPSQRWVVFLIAAIQFVNILDFVMVMPLGPDFSRALGIPESSLGLIGGGYTASAALAGLLASPFLDRFDRRLALGVAMLGLAVGTALGGVASGLQSLILARMVAGAFGGPATSLSFSIIADLIPPERLGRATGAVMGAFSVASVLGVPLGLYLAERLGWRSPFLAVAGLGLCLSMGSVFLLPSLKEHLQGRPQKTGARELLSRGTVRLSYLMTATGMCAGFMIIPNLSAYLQGNLGYPRDSLKWLYLAGGVVSFGTMRLVGHLVDRFGSFRVGTLGAALLASVLWVFFLDAPFRFPVMVTFVLFMVAMTFRNVAHTTLTTKVPRPFERARFQSLQSSVQHAASALGAFTSAQLLGQAQAAPGKVSALLGMERVATLSIGLSLLLPLFLRQVEARLRQEPPRGG